MSEILEMNTVNQAEEPNVITIDDGSIEVPIQNQFGEKLGVFRFVPTDINIVNRYNEVAEKFETALRPLIGASISPDGEGEDDESAEILTIAGKKMTELMDYVLNGNSEEAFFAKTHIFTPIGGKFYCEIVYDAIGQYISRKFSAEVKKVNARLAKHTHGYRTGKHAKGKA